jgi:hypothetical protein
VSDAAVDEPRSAPGPRTRGTGGAIYLGLLAIVAVALVITAVATDGGNGPTPGLPGVVEPVELVIRLDGAAVTLEGRVPEAEVRDQLVALAGARYDPSDVHAELALDDRMTLDGGSVAVTGSAGADDPDPRGLQADIASALLLRAGPVEVQLVPGEDDGPSVAMVPNGEG